MAPTIVFDEAGEIVLIIGAAGGPTIPVQVARSVIGVIDFGMSAKDALALPLLMSFGSVAITEEDSVVAGMVEELQERGHSDIRVISPRGKTNALLRTENGWEAAGDPRVAELLRYDPAPASEPSSGAQQP